MSEKDNRIGLSDGSISYAEDVVATIAGLAATEISGVAGMSGNMMSGITEMLGRRDFTKGVKVDVSNNDSKIDMYLVVNYGVKIHQVCREVQENVRKALDTMTNLNTVAINVHVQGIYLGNSGDFK